jgi:hypothetical protein
MSPKSLVITTSAAYPASTVRFTVALQAKADILLSHSFSLMDFLLGEVLESAMAWGSGLAFS